MTKEINAFHPDYMKTFHPDFMQDFRTNDANREEREGKKLRVSKKPLKMMTKTMRIRTKNPTHILTKEQQGMSMDEVRLELALKPKDFKYFSAAGANNVTPKGKKK
jgi:hypothetical protein